MQGWWGADGLDAAACVTAALPCTSQGSWSEFSLLHTDCLPDYWETKTALWEENEKSKISSALRNRSCFLSSQSLMTLTAMVWSRFLVDRKQREAAPACTAHHHLHGWLRSGEVPCLGPAWPQMWYPAVAATAGLGINAWSHLLMIESLCTALWSGSFWGHIWPEKLYFLWSEVGRQFNTSEPVFQVSSGDREIKTS